MTSRALLTGRVAVTLHYGVANYIIDDLDETVVFIIIIFFF